MRAIATPLAATGFSPRALAVLETAFRPLGLAPMAGGARSRARITRGGEQAAGGGCALSIAMVTGDFDLSGIGTVTHVEGNRVYGFGHPMFSLGTCEFPMMTGFIHTVYPRASVSMKMGSPLKVVGVIDTDVSTGVAGRIGPKPDMLPLSVRVKTGRYRRAPRLYQVQMVREPILVAEAGDGRADQRHRHRGQPARGADGPAQGTIQLKGHDPITLSDTLSGPRYTGPMGAAACSARSPRSSTPGSQPHGPAADRVDRVRGRDRARADGRA